jgi:hypothetical protein
MTGREVLDRSVRRVMRIVYVGFALCLGALIGGASIVAFFLVVLFPVGFVVAFIAIWYGHIAGVLCPWCKKNLFLIHQGGLRFGDEIVCCPYCGHNFDEEVSTPVQASAPLSRNCEIQ